MLAINKNLEPSVKIALLIWGLLSISCILVYLISPSFITFINFKITDAVVESVPPKNISDTVVVVGIDERSLQRFGQWPWPRYRLALLLNKIGQSGAKSIGLDFILAEPDRLSFPATLEEFSRDTGYNVEFNKVASEFKDNDLMFANVISNWPCVLGFEFLFDKPAIYSGCHLHPLKTIKIQKPLGDGDLNSFYHAQSVVCNLESFSKAVSASGFLNGIPDSDGIIRRIPLLIQYGEEFYSNLALSSIIRASGNFKINVINNSNGQKSLHIDDMIIPMDSRGNLCIYFPNKTNRVRHISAEDILTGQLPEEAIKGKIVLVGLTASGLSQVYQTRAGLVISAVEVQAQAAENIMSKIYIKRYPKVILSEIAIALLLTALFSICIGWFGFLINVVLGAIGILGIWQGSVQIFQGTGILVSPLLPVASLLITGIALIIFKYWQQQRSAISKADKALFLLKSSENQLDSIIKTIPDIVFRLDSSGRIIFISPAILKYEKRPEEIIGKHILELVHPKDRDIATYRINERRTGTRATYDKELTLLLNRKTPQDNDKYCYFSISAEGIYSSEKPGTNSFLGTQGIARDINKRKQLEYQLEQSKKMEAIGTLAAGVAHDLNNILGGLVGYPELLMMELPKDSPMRNRLEIIQKSGQKAAAIVQDMLSLARRGVKVIEILNLNTIISEFLSSPEFHKIIGAHSNVFVQTNLSDYLMNIKGSKIQLTKVLMNLILNAVEAMPAGGTITITTQDRYFDMAQSAYELIPEGEYVCLRIVDEGIGIDNSNLARIFEPFYTRKIMGKSGTGLGMTVVWNTVKDYKGFFDIQSSEGEGTKFNIFIPATRDAMIVEDRKAVLQDYIGTERILVVDDIPEQREIAERMLRKLGYKVTSVPSGEAAADYIKSHMVDLVVLDMIMEPGLDGLETYRRIVSVNPGQKAIIVSGFSESDRVKALQKLGAGAYIRKPYTLETIGLAIRKELKRELYPTVMVPVLALIATFMYW